MLKFFAIKSFFVVGIFLLVSATHFAQPSTWQIHWVDKTSNPAYFERNKSLSELLLRAVKTKKLTPYQLPQTNRPLQVLDEQSFQRNMTRPLPQGGLITYENDTDLSETIYRQWLAHEITLFAVYESQAQQVEYLALYVPREEQHIFIANFKFKDVEKALKNNKMALWQRQIHLGEILHLNIEDGSIYQIAKTLFNYALDDKITAFSEEGQTIINETLKTNPLARKIEDEKFSYQWLIRPIEKKQNTNTYQITDLELYYEDFIGCHFVARFSYESVKSLLVPVAENLLLPYAEALKQKFFISNLQSNLPTTSLIKKTNKRFKKQIISDMYLKDRENEVLYQEGNELVRILKDAVQQGQLTGFENDSLTQKLSFTEFQKRFTSPLVLSSDSWEASISPVSIRQLYKLHLVEEIIFDLGGKQKTYLGKAIAVVLPAEKNMSKGIDEPLVYFAYKDVMKLLKKKKQQAMLTIFEQRNCKAIPIYSSPIIYK